MVREVELPYREEWKDIIVEHIRAGVERAGASGVVLGLSGGIDSALVLALAHRALGPDKIACIHLPTASTPTEDGEHAEDYANILGVEYGEIPIGEAAKLVTSLGGEYGGMADANVQSRLRMIFLYYLANANNLLVLGTGNKTEILVGYFTKFGDGATDLLPIGDLYKTQVRKMSAELGVTQEILHKTPAAGLPGVGGDEEELGYTYSTLDKVLWGFEHGWDEARTAQEAGVSEEDVSGIRDRVRKNAHKRGLGAIPKIGTKTIGLDWREDRSW